MGGRGDSGSVDGKCRPTVMRRTSVWGGEGGFRLCGWEVSSHCNA